MIVIFFFEIGLLLPSFKIDPPFPPTYGQSVFIKFPSRFFGALMANLLGLHAQTENTRVILVVRDVITVIRGV